MSLCKAFALVMFGIYAFPAAALSVPRAVVAMATEESELFLQSPLSVEDPEGVAQWIMVNEQGDACELRYASWRNSYRDPNGYEIEGKDDAPGFFLARWDVVYTRERGSDVWDVRGPGAWLASGDMWTRAATLASGETVTRHLIWQGERSLFFNDPRDTDLRRGIWYRLGADGVCSVFVETSHAYGPFGIETVELATGLGAGSGWTLTTGWGGPTGIREIGNWLP